MRTGTTPIVMTKGHASDRKRRRDQVSCDLLHPPPPPPPPLTSKRRKKQTRNDQREAVRRRRREEERAQRRTIEIQRCHARTTRNRLCKARAIHPTSFCAVHQFHDATTGWVACRGVNRFGRPCVRSVHADEVFCSQHRRPYEKTLARLRKKGLSSVDLLAYPIWDKSFLCTQREIERRRERTRRQRDVSPPELLQNMMGFVQFTGNTEKRLIQLRRVRGQRLRRNDAT